MTRRRIISLILSTCFVTFLMAGCVYKPDVQQGNVITDKDVSAIHKGMTANQVRFKLGDPILTNIYADNRVVYVYSFQHGHHKMQLKRLIISLRNDHVTGYWYDSQPPNAPVIIPTPG